MKRPFPFHSNLVWPPPLLVGLFVLFYGIVTAGVWFLDFTFAQQGVRIFDTEDMVSVRKAILIGAAAIYALYRLWRFHPGLNQSYAAWLKASPWTSDRPLPCGPIHPVWQDAVPIGVLTAIALYHAHVNPALPALAFGFTYLLGMTLLLMLTRRWLFCLVLGFLWPALMLPGIGWTGGIAVIAGMLAVIWFGHRASLRAFPWDFLAQFFSRPSGSMLQLEIRIPGLGGAPATAAQTNVGWPFVALSPKTQPGSISTLTSIAVSALIAWWTFCTIVRSGMDPAPGLLLFFAIVMAIIRLAIYGSGVSAPFGLWGRIVSGQPLLPGFDKVFLTPLAAILVAITGGMIIRRSGSWYPAVESAVFALVWFVLFVGGPTLRRWNLTGQHRFGPPSQLSQNAKTLRAV